MKIFDGKGPLFRLWIAFLLVWTLLFGVRAYTAYATSQEAHDRAQGARVGGNILRASDPDLVSPYDPNFGDMAVSRAEATEREAEENFENALIWLFGGLAIGSVGIGIAHWIMFGSARKA